MEETKWEELPTADREMREKNILKVFLESAPELIRVKDCDHSLFLIKEILPDHNEDIKLTPHEVDVIAYDLLKKWRA